MYLRHLGYACQNMTLGTVSRTIRLANLRTEKVIPPITQNLEAIRQMVAWNAQHGIRFLRISSDVIPFATRPEFPFDWAEAYDWMFRTIRRAVKRHGMRVSNHPGQYTVLNALREEVVTESIKELDHQARLLRLIDPVQGTLTLHVGGAYGDKQAAMARFKQHFARLSEDARAMLTLENDDTTYTLDDVLVLCEALGIPLVFDFFHHRVLHAGDDPREGLIEKLDRAVRTWGRRVPKLHLSSAHPGPKGRRGAHADYVLMEDVQFVIDTMARVGGEAPYDLMLEAKQKERAVLEVQRYLETGEVPDRAQPMETPLEV